jgi:hypothetical protein
MVFQEVMVTLLLLFSNCIILSVLAVALAGTIKMAMSLFQVRACATHGSMINLLSCLCVVVLASRERLSETTKPHVSVRRGRSLYRGAFDPPVGSEVLSSQANSLSHNSLIP